jgi:nucleotide-binding universal stress UspA family protein
MYKTILVLLDGSKRAEAILDHIKELAGRLEAKVLFLHISEQPLLMGYGVDKTIDMSAQQQQEQRRKQVESYLTGIQNRFREKGIETQYFIAYGPVVRTILIVAEENNVDLIALASRGLNGSFRTVSTSVTARLLQRFNRPILLIRYESDE